MTDDELLNELYRVGHLRGLKPEAVKDAIARVRDRRKLLRDWKRAHRADSARILKEVEDKALADMAERGAEHHEITKAQARERREQQRRSMRLDQRLATAIAEATVLSSVSANRTDVDRVHGGARTSGVAPASHALEGLESHLFVIESRIRLIEQDLDHYRGLGPAVQTTTMRGADKDAKIVSKEMEGRAPEEIAQAYPWLGGPLTIRRVRRAYGLRSKDGTSNPKSTRLGGKNGAAA